MAHIERTDEAECIPEYDSVVAAQSDIQASMLYNILPTLVTNRIPTIPSLRRSLSGKKHGKSYSLPEISAPGTPPPDYTSRPPSGYVTPLRLPTDAEGDFSDAVSEQATPSPEFCSNVLETRTGINWTYASLGTNLMNQAHRESSALAHDANETTPTLARQLYVHGLMYLLRGLPNDMTSEEVLSIHAAIPQSVAIVQAEKDTHALVPLTNRTSLSREGPREEPTILHRLTATIVFQVFILIQFLMPYIKLFLSQSYQFERKHQIMRRFVNSSVATVDDLGRRSLRLSHTICQMNDGQVGQAINEATIWWVKGVTGGVQQGIEQGLTSMQATEPTRRRVVAKDDKVS